MPHRPPTDPTPETLIAVDPGLRLLGVSRFRHGRLVDAWLLEPKHNTRDGSAWAAMGAIYRTQVIAGLVDDGLPVVVFEKPQVYKNREGNPDDLLQLVGVLGACAAQLPRAVYYCPTPRQWKGQAPKKVWEARARRELDEDELREVALALGDVAPDLHHNVWDAVCLGLWAVGRLR